MQGPLQIRFHGLERTSVLSDLIEDRVAGLEHLFPHITDCTVALERGHHRRQKGDTLRVSIEIRVPGQDIVVSREHALDEAHMDSQIALRDAFDAAKRRLQDYVRKMRGDVKTHVNPYHEGRIARIFHDDGYGFIQNGDDREIYFHENSVIKGTFEELLEGSKVRYVEEMGEKGPQASSVFTIKT
jgi:cold shock CspA family protein/ribosome-associated translation inhibitor RaiA